VDLALADVSILEHIFNRWHALAEMREAELFELGTRNADLEIFTLSKSLTVDFRLMSRRKNSLGLFTLSSQSSHGSSVSCDVNLCLLLELGHAIVDEDVVKVLTSQMSVSICSLDFEDSVLNAEQGNIKGATTQIEDEHITLALVLLVESVGNGGRSWLVNDSLHVES